MEKRNGSCIAVVSPDDGLVRKSLSKVMLSNHDGAQKIDHPGGLKMCQ